MKTKTSKTVIWFRSLVLLPLLAILIYSFSSKNYIEYEHSKNEITTQKKASAEQIAEYNKLAKKYNSQSEDNRVFKLKDINRLEYLYSLMSKTQKANAEPFPNFPPPPPAPAPKINKGENPNPPEPPAPPKVKKGEALDIPPPPPPEPKSPLDYVIEMAKKGATFYYNGKKVSSDKAIDLMKNNKSLNISSNTKDGVSIIKIQTEPIRY